MIYAIDGYLVKKENMHVVMNVNGLMFELIVPLSTYTQLPNLQEKCSLYTEFIFGDNNLRLYGFYTLDEKNLFHVLRKIQKVSSKMAISILSTLSIDEFYSAISEKNEVLLSSIPGIGKKTALSIILELSNKIPVYEKGVLSDAIDALVSFGFNNIKAFKITKNIYDKNHNITLEELIKESLKSSIAHKNG